MSAFGKQRKWHFGAPALTSVLGNQVQLMFASMPSVLEYIRSDKLRALGRDLHEAVPKDTPPESSKG